MSLNALDMGENRPEALRTGEPGENTRYVYHCGKKGGARTAIEGGET